MLENFINRYYLDDPFDSTVPTQYGYTAKNKLPKRLWQLIDNWWFHDAYLTKLSCSRNKTGYTVDLDIQQSYTTLKKPRQIHLTLSSVTTFGITGNLMDQKASFPWTGKDKPLAQILAFWVEAGEQLTFYMLCDNTRYFVIHCKNGRHITMKASYTEGKKAQINSERGSDNDR